jgi:hypothetical protein
MISRGIYDSHPLRMSWHDYVQSVFAVIEFIIIVALILVLVVAMVSELLRTRKRLLTSSVVTLARSAPAATPSTAQA